MIMEKNFTGNSSLQVPYPGKTISNSVRQRAYANQNLFLYLINPFTPAVIYHLPGRGDPGPKIKYRSMWEFIHNLKYFQIFWNLSSSNNYGLGKQIINLFSIRKTIASRRLTWSPMLSNKPPMQFPFLTSCFWGGVWNKLQMTVKSTDFGSFFPMNVFSWTLAVLDFYSVKVKRNSCAV